MCYVYHVFDRVSEVEISEKPSQHRLDRPAMQTHSQLGNLEDVFAIS
jgi:hypothetical protein